MVHDELLKLGIQISQATVSKTMPRRPLKPPSQSWRTFLDNHMKELVSVDFFTVREGDLSRALRVRRARPPSPAATPHYSGGAIGAEVDDPAPQKLRFGGADGKVIRVVLTLPCPKVISNSWPAVENP